MNLQHRESHNQNLDTRQTWLFSSSMESTCFTFQCNWCSVRVKTVTLRKFVPGDLCMRSKFLPSKSGEPMQVSCNGLDRNHYSPHCCDLASNHWNCDCKTTFVARNNIHGLEQGICREHCALEDLPIAQFPQKSPWHCSPALHIPKSSHLKPGSALGRGCSFRCQNDHCSTPYTEERLAFAYAGTRKHSLCSWQISRVGSWRSKAPVSDTSVSWAQSTFWPLLHSWVPAMPELFTCSRTGLQKVLRGQRLQQLFSAVNKAVIEQWSATDFLV